MSGLPLVLWVLELCVTACCLGIALVLFTSDKDSDRQGSILFFGATLLGISISILTWQWGSK